MKKIFGFLVTTLLAHSVLAMPSLKDVEFWLNRTPGGSKSLLGYQEVANKIQTIKCQYDFSVQGGAIATISLKGPDGGSCTIPNKAVVLDTHMDVVTALASPSGATVSMSTGKAAGDIKTATAYGSVTGMLRGIPDGAAANMIKMVAEVTPSIAIASSTLTAGKFNVYISFVMGD